LLLLAAALPSAAATLTSRACTSRRLLRDTIDARKGHEDRACGDERQDARGKR
jgi:hypothetical protein